MTYTRRQFGRPAMASLPVAAMSSSSRFLLATAKHNSIFNGVLVGVITPYSCHFMPNDAESLLKFMVRDGISGTEIQCPPVEEFAGASKQPAFGGGPRPAGPVTGQQVGTTRHKPTPEQIAAQKASDTTGTSRCPVSSAAESCDFSENETRKKSSTAAETHYRNSTPIAATINRLIQS
jgi:hypothetical protein